MTQKNSKIIIEQKQGTLELAFIFNTVSKDGRDVVYTAYQSIEAVQPLDKEMLADMQTSITEQTIKATQDYVDTLASNMTLADIRASQNKDEPMPALPDEAYMSVRDLNNAFYHASAAFDKKFGKHITQKLETPKLMPRIPRK